MIESLNHLKKESLWQFEGHSNALNESGSVIFPVLQFQQLSAAIFSKNFTRDVLPLKSDQRRKYFRLQSTQSHNENPKKLCT